MSATIKNTSGKIRRVSGPIVEVEGLQGIKMNEMVRIGAGGLFGEVVALERDIAIIQVYEETDGLKLDEPVVRTGEPLSVVLGPGLLGKIVDGIQRPLVELEELSGVFISRGLSVDTLNKKDKWTFEPRVKVGDKISNGEILGVVKETKSIEHRIMVPPKQVGGKVLDIVKKGDYTIDEPIAQVQNNGKKQSILMYQKWPVRIPRPFQERLPSNEPLMTGQRTIDKFFPMAKGGTAAIPGGFGTGKTVMQQQLARWANAQIIVYVGCGERGNEMAEVLEQFPKLTDPYTGEPLMQRTILVANVSNMPIAAREASVYTGITMAEYYRDMGYDVALMADSTSRWAEAMREISGRLEEMPGEEGYPAYLSARVASFYERAGRVTCLGNPERKGSISIVGAVSPPGGDFSEPVTQNTLRVVKVFWALDTELSYRRHFPAINWLRSYSLYAEELADWFSKNTSSGWTEIREEGMNLLQREEELKEIVRIVGPEALSPSQRLLLTVARSVREDFLMQNAMDPIDSYSSSEKTYLVLKIILSLHKKLEKIIQTETVNYAKIETLPIFSVIARLRTLEEEEFKKQVKEVMKDVENLVIEE